MFLWWRVLLFPSCSLLRNKRTVKRAKKGKKRRGEMSAQEIFVFVLRIPTPTKLKSSFTEFLLSKWATTFCDLPILFLNHRAISDMSVHNRLLREVTLVKGKVFLVIFFFCVLISFFSPFCHSFAFFLFFRAVLFLSLFLRRTCLCCFSWVFESFAVVYYRSWFSSWCFFVFVVLFFFLFFLVRVFRLCSLLRARFQVRTFVFGLPFLIFPSSLSHRIFSFRCCTTSVLARSHGGQVWSWEFGCALPLCYSFTHLHPFLFSDSVVRLTQSFFLGAQDHGRLLYVRPCYIRLFDKVQEAWRSGKRVGVFGTPGIGKTFFLIYTLLRLIKEQPTATFLIACG